MARSISSSNTEEYVEDRLFAGLLTGSFLQHKELLDKLEDVDIRGVRQKTLLHVGVGLGKADWVEELLARGADPQLMDESLMNAMSSAEEMVRRFPEDLDRSEVLKLVSLVHRREQVMTRRLEISSTRSTAYTTPVAIPDQQIASLKSSVDALRLEMRSLVSQLRSSLEELKANMCGRDTLLNCLEDAVVSTAEDVASIKNGLGGEAGVSPLPSDPANDRQECVDAMLRKTEIVYGDGVDIMRRLYERLYDEDDCTACIIKYLSGDDRLKVLVDSESENIGRMKDTFVDLYGTQMDGRSMNLLSDLENVIVYLGATLCSDNIEKAVGALVLALLQMSLHLVFRNGGRPYEQSDAERECEWMRAMQEVEEKGGRFDKMINCVWNRRTQSAKVCCLVASVPPVITCHGSTAGRAILQKQAPLLLSLYSNHVMPTLLAKARR